MRINGVISVKGFIVLLKSEEVKVISTQLSENPITDCR